MVDFDPSPRSSKRRRTGTYATRRTTLDTADVNSSKDEEERPQLLLNPQGEKAPADDLIETLWEEAVPEDERASPASQETVHDELPAASAHPKPGSESRRTVGNTNHKSPEIIKSPAKRASSANEQGLYEVTPIRRNLKKVDEGNNTADKSWNQEKETETPGEVADTTDKQTRSSGRMRRIPKRFAANEDSTDVDVVSQRRSKSIQTTTTKRSPARQLSIQSPQPKGILTPSRKGKRTGTRKSVVFDGDDDDDKRIEEQFGFKDIDSSTKNKGKRAAKEAIGEPEKSSDIRDIEQAVLERATTPLDTKNDEEPLFDPTPDVEEILSQSIGRDSTVKDQAQSATVEDNEHVVKIKVEILNRLTTNSLSPVAHLEKEYTTLHTLLNATITAGESNSLLLLGSRGSGKTLLVEHALQDLTRKHNDDFHIVRLNGFFQTDDKLALREIWRQLGREMAVSEDETGEVSSYADTMASLLSLLSHPEEFDNVNAMDIDATPQDAEKTSKSVIFVLDEFDLFTTHPRQTLLYNLFDIAQAKKAPIAVVGCSTRMDVVDLLEKRVKSRFSHRWLHVSSMKSLVAFEEAVRRILCLPVDGHEALGLSGSTLEWRAKWNEFIKARFLSTRPIQSLVKKTFYSTKSIPDLLGALYIPIATLDLADERQDRGSDDINANFVLPSTQPSLLAILPQLPTLHLGLLIAGTRLETIHNLTTVNFTLVYSHYSELLARSKLQRSAYSALASGGAFTGAGLRSWSKETVRGAWEDLAAWEAIVPVAGLGGNSLSVGKLGDEGLGSDGVGNRMFRLDITLDEVAWAVKQKLGTVGAGDMLTKWCKEV